MTITPPYTPGMPDGEEYDKWISDRIASLLRQKRRDRGSSHASQGRIKQGGAVLMDKRSFIVGIFFFLLSLLQVNPSVNIASPQVIAQ